MNSAVVALLALTLFVAVRSPLFILAVPTLAWRFMSGNPNYWGTLYHYNAVLMVVVFAAFIDAVSGDGVSRTLGRYAVQVRTALAIGCLAVAFAWVPSRPLWEVVDGHFWRADPQVSAARTLLDRVPDGASVAATNRLSPQLTARCQVRLFPALDTTATADWVIADVAIGDWPYPVGDVIAEVDTLRATGYRAVAEADGFVLLSRV